jgi:hypothetical protein
MNHLTSFRLPRLALLRAFLLLFVCAQVWAQSAPANLVPPESQVAQSAVDKNESGQNRSPSAVNWVDGPIQYAPTVDCITGVAIGIGSYVGQLVDTADFSQPTVGQGFYIRVGAASLAAPCVNLPRLGVFFAPPSGVNISPEPGSATRCFSKAPQQTALQEFTQGCPQPPYTIQTTPGGTAFSLPDPSPGSSGLWPFPFGSRYEFWIPVRSTRPMNGLNTTPGIQLAAAIWYLDGNTSPWRYPQLSMIVAAGSPQVDPIFRNGFE